MPALAIRGVSDKAGGKATRLTSAMSSCASNNAVKVAVTFIEMIGGDALTEDGGTGGDRAPCR